MLGRKEEALEYLDKAIEIDKEPGRPATRIRGYNSKIENAVKKLKKDYDLSSN